MADADVLMTSTIDVLLDLHAAKLNYRSPSEEMAYELGRLRARIANALIVVDIMSAEARSPGARAYVKKLRGILSGGEEGSHDEF